MATVEVEVTIASARDLKNVNWKHGDLCAYAAAWVEGGGGEQVRVSTKVDASGDTAPCWDQKFTLPVSKQSLEQARFVVEVFHDTRRGGDLGGDGKALVGRASLPLLEVVDAGGFDEVQEYTVKLKRPSGRPHGKVELALRLRERRGAYGGAPYGGQRDFQAPYPGYNPTYPAQPYGQQSFASAPPQGYPASSGYPPASGYSPASSGYPPASAYPYAAPQPYGYAPPQASYSSYPAQPYGAPPPQGDYYGQHPTPSPYQDTSTAAAAAPVQKKGSKFGGLGAGLAAGALAGAIGGIALDEFVDHKEDEAADRQEEEDAERYDAGRDDDYGGGRDDDYGGGRDDDDYGGGNDDFF